MSTYKAIETELNDAIKEVIDVGLSDVYLSREEVMALMARFYGAVILATEYMVITPEKARYHHNWLVSQLGL